MRGMNNTTGKAIESIAHPQQSVRDILTTPIGSRVIRRDYGSLLPELLDQPLSSATVSRLYAAASLALLRRETRRVWLEINEVKNEKNQAIIKFLTEKIGPMAVDKGLLTT